MGLLALALLASTTLTSGANAQLNTPKFLKATALAPKTVAPGKPFDLTISVLVDKPYHVQANPATEGYIATEVKLGAVKGFTAGKAVYPKGMEAMFSGDKLSVYEGAVKIHLSVTPDKSLMPGKFTLPLLVHYQGCNEKACFPPTDAKMEVVVVVGKATQAHNSPTSPKTTANTPMPPIRKGGKKSGARKPPLVQSILAPIRN